MVVCHKCRQERLVTRNMSLQPVFPQPPEEIGEMVSSDPSKMVLMFRCNICKTAYTFERIVTSDELRENKKSKGCGGCGP